MDLIEDFRLSVFAAVSCVVACWLPIVSTADTVSTAVGGGADIEMREQNNPPFGNTSNGAALNTRFNTTDRNEVVGLRFDLTGYTLVDVENVSLNLVNYRTNLTRVVDIYGVNQGAVSGTGSFTTETWNETALSVWGDLPGLLISDGDITTTSLDMTNLTLLVDGFTISNLDEGTVETARFAALTTWIQNYTGSGLITLVLASGNASTGQFRFASKEAAGLTTIPGTAGEFAPYLAFTVADDPPLQAPVITNAVRVPGSLVLSGTGGSGGEEFFVLSTPDLSVPATNWPAIATNTFEMDGSFSSTNPVEAGADRAFFGLVTVGDQDAPDYGLIGYAAVSGGTTGGSGGPTQTVSSAAAFLNAVGMNGLRVVQVDGTIELNGGLGSASIASDKTILGLGTNAMVIGQLNVYGTTNVIIRNLSMRNTGEPGTLDGVRINAGAHHVWVDHCTFTDCADGEVDITQASDYVTVSWCIFNYVNQTEHAFVNLIAASETDAGDYRITFHHNWWSTGCDRRMPMSRYGTVHLFNNYYNAPGNSTCSSARTNAQFFSENNFYANVDDPIYRESNGRIKASGNVYQNCAGRIDPGTNTVFTPPYVYALDPTLDTPVIATKHAGAGRGPFAP